MIVLKYFSNAFIHDAEFLSNRLRIFFPAFMILLFAYLLPITGGNEIYGQNKNMEFTKANFPDNPEKLKEAINDFKEGDRYFNVSPALHPIALNHFLKAQEFNPNNAELNMKIGRCYLNSNQKLKSLDYLERAVALDPKVDLEIDFYFGQAFQLRMMWDNAIESYKKYMTAVGEKDTKTQKLINKKIEECNNGRLLTKDSILVLVENLALINTPFAEYGPVISADESVMIFTARTDKTTGGAKDPGVNQYYEDIYITNSVNGVWESPKNIGPPVNTIGHNSAMGLSVDGQKLFVYVGDQGDGDIFVSKLKGNSWSKPEKLDKTINSVYRESSASFSPDEKTLYFVSARLEGNLGDRDIFYSRIDEKGKWGKPENMGPVINTVFGEEGVFMHPDGKTLFFSSQGHNSMGGYDIFKSVFDETIKQWSKPENLGHPVNTPDDDVFVVFSADGKHAYFTSVRPEGKGEKDIYRITFLEDIMKKNVALFKGRVIDDKANPLGAKITIRDKSKGEIIGTFESNSESGKFLISLSSGKTYLVDVFLEGYIPFSESLDIPYKSDYQEIVREIVLRPKVAYMFGNVVNEKDEPLDANIEVVDNATNQVIGKYQADASGKFRITVPTGKNYGVVFTKPGYLFQSVNAEIPDSADFEKDLGKIILQKVDIGKKIVLNNIFFDFNKATISQESFSELDRAVKLMNEIKSLQIEISGHTDNVGTESYNQKLSEQRAKAVVSHLISKGIDKKRLSFKGYGFSQPVSTNDTEEGRQLNRRTEFKVVKVDLHEFK